MNPRPSWDTYGLSIAEAAATRADCTRRKVGAVIMTPDHSVVAMGYNGAPSKGGSCLLGDCPRGQRTFEAVEPGSSYDTGVGACIALHAEQNALLRATWEEMRLATMYVTCKPCDGCRRMLTGSPIDRVVWPEGESLVKDWKI